MISGLLAVALLAAPGGELPLSIRFIGNEGVEISDGKATLLVDFPYVSGAFGYMSYDPSELKPRANSICLFTHRHDDHFAPELIAKLGCRVLAPPDAAAKVKNATAITSVTRVGEITITPRSFEHAGVDHHCYLIEWNGRRLYFTGDTALVEALVGLPDLDVAFLSPWLATSAAVKQALPQAKQLVIYHHRDGETVPACKACLVPKQRDVIR